MAVEFETSSRPRKRVATPKAGPNARAGDGPSPAAMARAQILLRRFRLPLLVLAALVLGAAVWLVWGSGADSGGNDITATVSRGDIEDTVTAVGNLQPRDYVDVGAQASGQLKKLYVEIGDKVKQGQLLAEIDPQVQVAKVAVDTSNVANLKAQLADRRAQAALAQANLERQKRLMKADATSRSSYDSAVQAAQSAQAQSKALAAQIAAAQSQLNGDTVTLGYTKVYAPMDGTVVSVTAKQGQTLNANQTAPIILRIGDLSTMTVWTQVSEADVPKLKIGMPAYFTTLGNPGTRWSGTLTQIQPTPTVVNNVVLYTATFDVKNPGDRLMTQMTAQVFFVVASARNAITVPVAALHQDGHAGGHGHRRRPAADGAQPSPRAQDFTAVREALKADPNARRYSVAVMDGGGAVHRKPVAIGVANRVSAEVLAGLKPGDKVVVGTQQSDKQSAADSHSGRHHFGPRL